MSGWLVIKISLVESLPFKALTVSIAIYHLSLIMVNAF